jgi:hypothetical protein
MSGIIRHANPLAAVALSAAGMVAPAAPANAQDLDLDVIFRCNGESGVDPAVCAAQRDVIINNCTVCHTFVPIVMQQWSEDEWRNLLVRHVENGRVGQLSPDDVDALQAYLTATFNPDLPPPDLPEELLKTWTAY